MKKEIGSSDNIELVFGEPHEKGELRHEVCVVVQRKSDKKFLVLTWPKFSWITPVLGGIEANETPEAAAERELIEETGYKGKAVKRLGGVVVSHFFAEHKNVWRHRISQPILVELLDEIPNKIPDAENIRHTTEWMSKEEVLKKMSHVDNLIGIRRYLGLKDSLDEKELKKI